jgi:hypothetical protein
MMEKIKAIANDVRWNEILFTLMILSFPFGSSFLSFSVGFMTIYPYFVLLCILTVLGFFHSAKINTRLEKFYLLFLLFFLAYAAAFLPFAGSLRHALVDMRSIVLMLMTAWVFISVEKVIGFERWKSVVLFSFKLIFFLVLGFAAFEIMTGIHFAGFTTSQVEARGIEDSFAYTPVFLWDNPNNLVVYFFLIANVIILLEPAGPRKNMLTWLVVLTCFFISFVAQARLGILLSLFMMIVIGLHHLSGYLKTKNKNPVQVRYALFALVVLGVVYATKEKFYGIPGDKIRECRDMVLYQEYHTIEQRSRLLPQPLRYTDPTVKSDEEKKPEVESRDERMALLKNGVDFIISSKFLGIGPGQYTFRHDTNQIKYYAFGNNGAHFWLVELLSQYGIFVFLLYTVLLIALFWLGIKLYRSDRDLAVHILLALVCFGVCSIMPSAFLILDINWIFIVILVIICARLQPSKLTGR